MSEARAIASLSHENILPIYHVEKFENNPILVFPLLPGSTLQKALQEKQFSVEESLQIIRDIARALAFIHARGILHRDIKPSNIWLGQREDGGLSARLFDFGFVGLQQNRSGTSGYMAPEQINHLPNSSATDMFALGSLMFQLFKGKKTPQKIQSLIEQLLASDPAARPDANQVIKILENRQRPGRKAVLIGAGMVLGLLVLFGVLRFRGQSV
ncbi:MAG: serine/threonine protein kinase, partial [Planctomycetia bacterium]